MGPKGALDIQEDLIKRRPWHQNVTCKWDGRSLILQAETNFDVEGLALMDEFSDAIAASITDGFDGDIQVLSVSAILSPNS